MKKFILGAAAAAMTLTTFAATAASADPYHGGWNRGGYSYGRDGGRGHDGWNRGYDRGGYRYGYDRGWGRDRDHDRGDAAGAAVLGGVVGLMLGAALSDHSQPSYSYGYAPYSYGYSPYSYSYAPYGY